MSTFFWILTSALNSYIPERIYCLEGWVSGEDVVVVALLVQALHQSRLITFIIISFSFLTLSIIIIITIITVTFLFLFINALEFSSTHSGRALEWARITLVSKDHLGEQGPLAVRLEVEQLLAVLQLLLQHAPRHLHNGQGGGGRHVRKDNIIINKNNNNPPTAPPAHPWLPCYWAWCQLKK